MTSNEANLAPLSLPDFQRLLASCRVNAMNHLANSTRRINRGFRRSIHRLMNRVRDNQGRLLITRVQLAEAEFDRLTNRRGHRQGPTRRRLREMIRQLESRIRGDLAVAAQLDRGWRDGMQTEAELRRRMSIVALNI